MSPIFPDRWSPVQNRDSLKDGVHPGVLAAHDLFNMFAVMYNLPLALNHLPLREHTSPAEVMRFSAERVTSIFTHLEYYCSGDLQENRSMAVGEFLFDFLFRNIRHAFSEDEQLPPWLDLLIMSRDLEFPELYTFIILEAGQCKIPPVQIDALTDIMEMESSDEADAVLDEARQNYVQKYHDDTGMIVHIPLMFLQDYQARPRNQPSWPMKKKLEYNAKLLAGSIWEAHMQDWAYWRGLTHCRNLSYVRGQRLKWKQRFARYTIQQHSRVEGLVGVWATDDKRM